jgi:hypothetical protein
MTQSQRSRRGISAANAVITIVVLGAVAAGIWAVATMDPRGERTPRTGRDYAAEAHEAGKIDPDLIGWEESIAPVAVDMEEPVALAVDAEDRRLVIGDRLVILDARGESLLRSAPFEEPYRDLVPAGNGRVYAMTRDRIDLLEVGGDEVAVIDSLALTDRLAFLEAITRTTHGVYVADSRNYCVHRVPPAPWDEDTLDAIEVVAEKLNVPSTMELAATPDGELITVDPGRHRVQERDVYGDVVRQFGKMGTEVGDFHGCCNPVGVATFPDGRTVTAEKGLAATRVKVYTAAGELETVVAAPDRFDELPNGPMILLDVAVDAADRVIVLDPNRRQVRVFTPRTREGGEDR